MRRHLHSQAKRSYRQFFTKMLNAPSPHYCEEIQLANVPVGSKRRLAILAISFLLLSVLSLAAALTTSVAKADPASLVVTPSSGPKNILLSLVGSGLPPNTQMVITCGSTNLGLFTSSPEGTVATTFSVNGEPGTYNIFARNGDSIFAATAYTVVGAAASPASPTSTSGSQAPTTTYPGFSANPITPVPYSYKPSTAKPTDSGISPLMIGAIVVVIVIIIIPVTFFVRRRGGPEPTYEEASKTPSTPAPIYTPRAPTYPAASRYSQTQTYAQYPSRSPATSRPGMPPRYGQPAVATRVCPRCRQTIRADYSVCPHCHKRLR